METITFECEVITPMFLAGADGRTPELRAPSIKGALRFWWRAMNGHLSIERLREEEAKIFGGSGDKEGKSKFSIKIIEKKSIISSEYRPLPHSKSKKFKSPAIDVGFGFSLEVKLKETDVITKEQLKNLFTLTSILGGLGKRARRGFGSFKIDEIDYNDLDWLNLLNSINIKESNSFENRKDNSVISCFEKKTYPYIKEIRIGTDSYDNYDELLKKIGKASHDCNSDFTGFAKNKKRFASPVYVSIIKRNNDYLPIVTILKTVSNELSGKDKSKKFISEVLS